EDLRSTLLTSDIVDIGADTISGAYRFARQRFVAAENSLAPAEIHDDVAVFDPLHDAMDDVADAVLVFVILTLALGLTYALHDDLLRVLGSDTSEIDRRQCLGDDKIANSRFRIVMP